VIAGRMPTTTISAEEDGTIYQVEIVDFKNRMPETPVLLEEAIFLATQEGKLISDTTARTDNGAQYAKYGRRVTVLTKDGGKKISELYLVNGLLLKFEGIITPKGRPGESRSRALPGFNPLQPRARLEYSASAAGQPR
jgi:hypothetical protein